MHPASQDVVLWQKPEEPSVPSLHRPLSIPNLKWKIHRIKRAIVPHGDKMEHIDWFKRFAAAYLRYVAFKFNQIVADSLKKHTEGMKHGSNRNVVQQDRPRRRD